MSNPITRSNPAPAAVRTMPTIPPAGPDSSASLPPNALPATSPPLDCMNNSPRSAQALPSDVSSPWT